MIKAAIKSPENQHGQIDITFNVKMTKRIMRVFCNDHSVPEDRGNFHVCSISVRGRENSDWTRIKIWW